ncbi:Protein with RNI-like/FBD-like domains [Euphorbia peplus]|nr:Protein with RNI-like/FBD-like domains [Euphorbia peplus]
METRSVKRRKFWFGEDYESLAVDRISNLPDSILHHILLLLPIKSIAQTSVLSRRWRSLWSSFPDLDFTSIVTSTTSRRSSSSMDLISHVLTLRDKNSDLRSLRFKARLSFSGFNSLIRSAIRHNVQEIDAQVSTEDYFNFPRGVISSDTLRVFRLKSPHPGFRLLPSSVMSGGFRSLKTLSLSLVILNEQSSLVDLFTESSFPNLKNLSLEDCFGMKRLKISCRGLEDLTLENCFQLQELEINCGKLEKLRVGSCFDAYNNEKSWIKIKAGEQIRSVLWELNAITRTSSLENLRSVKEVSVGFDVVDDQDLSLEQLHSVCDLLSGFSHAHTLILQTQSIEILSSKNYSSNLVRPFNKVKKLELHTAFNKNNIHGLASLFRSTPELHTLIFKIINVNDVKMERRGWNKELWDMSNSKEEQYWESQIQELKPFLSNLKIVQIDGFLECENEVSLAKFLLKHCKDLQQMTLCSPHSNCREKDSLRRQKIRSQIMGYSSASSSAIISFQ